MYWDYCSLFIKTTKVSLCCEVCHFTTPLYTWASPRLCGCWFSWCAPSTTAPPAGFAVQGSPVSVPHCGCWELFPPVSIAGPCSGDWTRKGWHQTLSLYDFHSSHQLQPGLHGACKHHAQESRSLWAFYFSSVQDEIWLANKKNKITKTCCSHRQGAFRCFSSSSALLGASISESDATWFPFTLVIWLLTNFLWNKMLSEHDCGTKCTHTQTCHMHTHIHACTPTHTGTHTQTCHMHTHIHACTPTHTGTHTHKEALSLLNVPCSVWCRNFPIWSHDTRTSLCTPRPTAMVINTSGGD